MVSCIRRVGGQWLLSMISSDGWKSVKGRSDINRNTQGQREMTKATTRKEAFAEITDFVSQFGDNIVSIKTVSSSFPFSPSPTTSWLPTRIGYSSTLILTKDKRIPNYFSHYDSVESAVLASKEQYHVVAGSIETKCQEIIPHFQPSSRLY